MQNSTVPEYFPPTCLNLSCINPLCAQHAQPIRSAIIPHPQFRITFIPHPGNDGMLAPCACGDWAFSQCEKFQNKRPPRSGIPLHAWLADNIHYCSERAKQVSAMQMSHKREASPIGTISPFSLLCPPGFMVVVRHKGTTSWPGSWRRVASKQVCVQSPHIIPIIRSTIQHI